MPKARIQMQAPKQKTLMKDRRLLKLMCKDKATHKKSGEVLPRTHRSTVRTKYFWLSLILQRTKQVHLSHIQLRVRGFSFPLHFQLRQCHSAVWGKLKKTATAKTQGVSNFIASALQVESTAKTAIATTAAITWKMKPSAKKPLLLCLKGMLMHLDLKSLM